MKIEMEMKTMVIRILGFYRQGLNDKRRGREYGGVEQEMDTVVVVGGWV